MLRRIFPFTFAAVSLLTSACGLMSPHYMPTKAWSQVDDFDEAVRLSGAADLPCAPADVIVDRINIADGSRSPVFLDIAEGCGRRVTYTERCGREPVIPPGLTEEQAAQKSAATLDPDREITCRFVAIGRVPLQGAPPRGYVAAGTR